ncbi:hypothetical protein ACFQ58_01125 [Agromyces sp. NPDC056523]|uniref:hypothetical protein n=1 Tax=Agromyces sp. NPDC056523 TaxID=3345850 RepID=UPI003671E43E
MSSTERVAELQRIAYGVGASDGERAAAADELEGLRRAAVPVEVDDVHPRDPVAPGAAISGSPSADPDADPFDGVAGPGADADVPERSPSNTVRWAALAGAVALAVGFGAGWLFGAQSAPTLDAPGAGQDGDVTFDLIDPDTARVPVENAPALAVFERAQVPEDIPTFLDPSIETASYRRLLTLPDGATVHAARAAGGTDFCVVVEHPDVGAGSACTGDGMFPPDGLWSEMSFDGDHSYRVTWPASGEVMVDTTPAG